MLISKPFILLGAAVVAASAAPAASAATQRYASPNGGDTACTSADPCSITKAVGAAGAGDEVIVNPGDYQLTATLTDSAKITIHGVPGKPRPRIAFGGGVQFGLQLLHGSTLRYVEVQQNLGSNGAITAWDGTVDQVIAKAPGSTVTIQNGKLLNSIVVATGSISGPAVQTGGHGNTVTSTYRNVTAIATAPGGVAMEAFAYNPGGNATIHATNVIARATSGMSFKARTDSSGAHATIIAAYSSFGGLWTVGTNAEVTHGLGNQGYDPVFVNAAAGDYRQAAGSPTIGKGQTNAANGPLDVDGDPRAIGTTDIGADEFVVAPVAATGAAAAVGDRTATLSGSVDAKGAPTSYRFEYGPTAAYGSTTAATDAGSGSAAVAAEAALAGLSPETTYHYRVVATNTGGVSMGDDRTFTTTAAPVPAPPAPSPTPAPPAPRPFAGVSLVSARLPFARRFIRVTLRCPSGTAGRCSGRTRLTARGRRPGTRAASTVTLGRATFLIAAGKQAKVRVRVSRAGRRLLTRTRRLRGRASNAARDGAGQSKTTVAAVTIRRRHR